MHGPTLTMFQRAIASAVALLAVIVSVAVCSHEAGAENRRGLRIVLGGYKLVLLATFLFGVLTDDGFGWAFLPLMVATAPWSFFAAGPLSRLLDQWGIGNWIGPLLMNFLVLMVVCGGLNVLVLYFFIRKIGYPGDRPSIT
jgi:hypothetical protein